MLNGRVHTFLDKEYWKKKLLNDLKRGVVIDIYCEGKNPYKKWSIMVKDKGEING